MRHQARPDTGGLRRAATIGRYLYIAQMRIRGRLIPTIALFENEAFTLMPEILSALVMLLLRITMPPPVTVALPLSLYCPPIFKLVGGCPDRAGAAARVVANDPAVSRLRCRAHIT